MGSNGENNKGVDKNRRIFYDAVPVENGIEKTEDRKLETLADEKSSKR